MSAPRGEVEVSEAAIGGYRRLLGTVRGRLVTYAAGDGGLICEDRSRRARPTLWRVGPDGAVAADTPYDYVRSTFVAAGLPRGLGRR